MSAMDYVTFDIEVENRSDIKIKYQTKLFVKADNGLFDELEVTTTINNATEDYSGKEIVSSWVELDVDADPETITLTLGLPEDSNAQNKSCEIEYAVYAVQGNAHTEDPVAVWDGTTDTSWYNPASTETEYELANPAQISGFGELIDSGETFEGKTITLDSDMDFYKVDDNGEPICFEPIGSYRNDNAFKGTFDGKGHTISNISQNTWALNNGYYYGDLGMGLFSKVEDATIKNLIVDGSSVSGEYGLCAGVAATAYGDCTFENIKITNSDVADYNYYAGGVVGWASGDQRFIDCDIDETTTIVVQWSSFGNATGGIIAATDPDYEYYMEDCDVACRIDAFNDVTSAYQWGAYRRCGMLIGDTGYPEANDSNRFVGTAEAPFLTTVNCTVTYGEWANYTYCQFNAMAYPWVRVQAGVSSGAYSNARYGHPTDADGNTVVDDNHTHNVGEAHHKLMVFDQLYGGSGNARHCVYGNPAHPGTTVIYNNK